MGCGDSAGDFGDASWESWVADVVAAADWLREQSGHEPVLWGLRAGCLLVMDVALRSGRRTDQILWQPVLSGHQHLQQFLRLNVANQFLKSAKGNRVGTAELYARLQSGEAVDVAGYRLSANLALGLSAAELTPPAVPSRIAWFEITGVEPFELSPGATAKTNAWRTIGHDVSTCSMKGPPFWQTQEIAEVNALVDATNDVLCQWKR